MRWPPYGSNHYARNRGKVPQGVVSSLSSQARAECQSRSAVASDTRSVCAASEMDKPVSSPRAPFEGAQDVEVSWARSDVTSFSARSSSDNVTGLPSIAAPVALIRVWASGTAVNPDMKITGSAG